MQVDSAKHNQFNQMMWLHALFCLYISQVQVDSAKHNQFNQMVWKVINLFNLVCVVLSVGQSDASG